jgi:uncharacterized protein
MSKTALFKAAKEWDAPEARRLLAAQPALAQALDPAGRTALHLCAGQPLAERPGAASVATAKALIAGGTALETVQPIADDGEIFPATALWYAVARGRNPDLVAFLLKQGANPDHCLWATAWANDAGLTRMLLKAGARTELRFDGETPLVYAARLGREAAILALVAGGADIRAVGKKGRTPHELARKKRVASAVLAKLAPQD